MTTLVLKKDGETFSHMMADLLGIASQIFAMNHENPVPGWDLGDRLHQEVGHRICKPTLFNFLTLATARSVNLTSFLLPQPRRKKLFHGTPSLPHLSYGYLLHPRFLSFRYCYCE
jgi:hypothetical protein